MLRYKVGLTGLVLVVGILAVVPATVSADGGATDFIHACVRGHGGVRIVGPDDVCKPHETPVHWPASSLSPLQLVTGTTAVDTTTPKAVQAVCPAETNPISGGAQILPAPYVPGIVLQSSAPVLPPDGSGWLALAFQSDPLVTPYPWGLRVDAFCTAAVIYYYGASLMGPVRPVFAWSSLALVAGLVVSQFVGWRRRGV